MIKAVQEQIIRSNCRGCHGGCGVLVHVKGGRITNIEGDPECPTNHGTMCSRGLAFKQLVYHPDRVTHPLKRTGEKGEGKWQRIPWDEALDTIAVKYKEIVAEYGAEAIVLGQGTGRDYEAFMYRFANLLGTPNVLTAGHMCYVSRVGATLITCGGLPVCDYDNDPKCVMVWGCNPVWTNPDEYTGENLSRVLSEGAKLIIVDPKLTYLAGRADVWLQLRPGTDTALALGMANVIISEDLYDKEFVEKYVHGWDEFVERVKEYPLDKVEDITWVPADKIREAARLYAQTKPACIQWGVAIEQTINCTDNNRILTDLMAITGNLDVPGGNAFFIPPPMRTVSQFGMHRDLSPEQREKHLGGNTYKLAQRVALVTPKVVWDAILTGKPYPVKAVQLHGSNPLITRANAREVYQALSQVDFLVVADFFLTPTAELADIVLPAATWVEMNYLGQYWCRGGYIFPRQKVVQIGECWQDHKMFMELGKKLGQEEYWFDTVEDAFDYILEPSGLTWEQVKEMPYLRGEMEYKKHEKKGFSTPTGKVELYSTIFENWGYDPLPQYREIPESPVSRPEMSNEYPYILTTGARVPALFHSENRMIPWLREIHPDPIIEIHPETAERHGIKDGDWIFIQSPRGKVRQRAKLTTTIDPRVIAAQHGWWFPEVTTPDHDWDRSNINIVTDNDPAGYDPPMGSTNLRVLLCKIYPVEGEG
ncbi:MAG: molybdopterin-dependent oxidoreductase [Dehalococcoidales bacterium]|nr:MAG: molybdopterin-dependent oxidoreductase [Dehalococcoidales bacterium]